MNTQETKLNVRMTKEERNQIQKRSEEFGFRNVSEFIRVIAIKGILNLK
jgi:hypothetical protein